MNDDGPRVLFTLFGADAESASNIPDHVWPHDDSPSVAEEERNELTS